MGDGSTKYSYIYKSFSTALGSRIPRRASGVYIYLTTTQTFEIRISVCELQPSAQGKSLGGHLDDLHGLGTAARPIQNMVWLLRSLTLSHYGKIDLIHCCQ